MEHFDWIKGAVFPYINFALFFIVLVWAAKKPMKAMAEARYRKYVDLHAEAKNAFEAAKKQNEELRSKMDNLQNEIDQLRKVALDNAKHEYDVLIEQAKHLGEHIADEAKMIAEAEVENAKEIIREEIVSQLKSQVISKIKTDMNEGDQKDLVKKQFGKVESIQLGGARL